MEIEQLKCKVANLEQENKELHNKLEEANKLIKAFKTIFTEGQMRKMSTKSKIKWQWEDISKSLCLHAAGPRSYIHLYKNGFPLPHPSTLRRWCQNVNFKEGIIYPSIELLESSFELSDAEKICCLAFDEMKIMESYEYFINDDVVKEPAKYVQVIVARGIVKSWKQPIFFQYDCPVTINILFDLIQALEKQNFPVVAIVSDMGPTNRKLWKELQVTNGKLISKCF